MRSSGRGGDQEEYQSLIGRRAQSASRILLVEARYVAIVTGVLLGLYSGQHLVSGRAAHVTIAAAPPQEEPPERTPQEEPPAPTKKPAVERRPRAVVRWPEVRERVFARQVQIEQDGKKSKKILHYAGPRVSGYLYVGPGHVRRDLRGAKQPGNVTEAQCSRVCSDNPACKGFAWCARAGGREPTMTRQPRPSPTPPAASWLGRFRKPSWSTVPECYLKDLCPSDQLRPMEGAFSWEHPRRCDSNARYQAQARQEERRGR